MKVRIYVCSLVLLALAVIAFDMLHNFKHHPSTLLGMYEAKYDGVTQLLTLNGNGEYIQEVYTDHSKHRLNKGHWSTGTGFGGGETIDLKNALIDGVSMGGAPGSFYYTYLEMDVERSFLGSIKLSINEDLGLYFNKCS